MNFEQENPGFRPVTITLETEDEAKIVAAAMAHAIDDSDYEDGDLLYRIYRGLLGVVPKWNEAYACNGDVTITKR